MFIGLISFQPRIYTRTNVGCLHVDVQVTASTPNTVCAVDVNGFQDTRETIVVNIFAHPIDEVNAILRRTRTKSRVDVHCGVCVDMRGISVLFPNHFVHHLSHL